MKTLFLTFFGLFFIFSASFAQKQDSTQKANSIEIRRFDQKKIDEFRGDKDFLYSLEVVKEPSLLNRIWAWILNKLLDLLGTDEGWTTFKVILYIFSGVTIIYIIARLLGVDVAGLVRREAQKATPDYMIESDNIHEIDFKTRLDEAVRKQDYRNAIRLLYLLALRSLADKDLIKWKLNKTNQEYGKELKTKGLANDFAQITYFFEWVWYGHFEIDSQKFLEMRTAFQEFEQKIK